MLVRERVVLGTLGDADLDRVVARDALGELEAGLSSVRHYGEHGEAREDTVSVFIESFVVPPRMIIFGAVDFTAALANVAKLLGFHVVVCDARAVFATVLRFPMADEVVNEWPNRYLEKVGKQLTPRDAVCVLTHDHKFDVPAIVSAVETDVGYIGAMGSRRTNEGRVVRLREAGELDGDVARDVLQFVAREWLAGFDDLVHYDAVLADDNAHDLAVGDGDEIHAANGELEQRGHEDDADLIAQPGQNARGEMQHFVDFVGVTDLIVDHLPFALRERARTHQVIDEWIERPWPDDVRAALAGVRYRNVRCLFR